MNDNNKMRILLQTSNPDLHTNYSTFLCFYQLFIAIPNINICILSHISPAWLSVSFSFEKLAFNFIQLR